MIENKKEETGKGGKNKKKDIKAGKLKEGSFGDSSIYFFIPSKHLFANCPYTIYFIHNYSKLNFLIIFLKMSKDFSGLKFNVLQRICSWLTSHTYFTINKESGQ